MNSTVEDKNVVENAEYWVKAGDVFYNDDKYEEAIKCYEKTVQFGQIKASTFLNWGIALHMLARTKKDVDLFKKALEKYNEAIQIGSDDASVFFHWGITLFRLAEFKQDENFKKNLKKFENASKEINDSDTFLIKGELFFFLNQTEKAMEYFKKSGKSILKILTFLDYVNGKKMIETNFLHPLLDSNETEAGKFFNETAIKKLTPEQIVNLDEYKKIYIRSIFIINLLHVNNINENFVAHYREKIISQKLLFENGFKFRLNAVDYSNDPNEGKTLLDFLYGKNNYKTDEELNTEYEAFASSFVFDYDNLNMFRLYGKDEKKKEGTGLSLVFKDTFFNKDADMAIGTPEKNKSSLYRCIYIDPHPETTRNVVTVGHKEEYLFYREKKGDDFEKYNKNMKEIVERVRKEMGVLKKQANKLDNKDIVGQLLLNLRYLVKHVAFKEEQECRIVKILNFREDKGSIIDDSKQMYIEYESEVSEHIAKIIFGPKAEGFELFKNRLLYKELNIPCEKSKNSLA